MKNAAFGFCALLVMCVGGTVNAQCGCGASHATYHQPAMTSYHPLPPAPRPTGISSSTVAYVNKLAMPVPRANYTLNYAVHLTDGRILLSDFVPPGHVVRGIESQTGAGGRRLNASSLPTGAINVTDPTNNSTVATFTPGSGY